jgi:RimJ/RimL family protein N-acetyltransferase
MDCQPVLEGERLLLRPLRPEDWSEFQKVAGDPKIWELHPQPLRWREPALSAYFSSLIDGKGALAVIDKASGALVGASRYQYGSAADGGTIEIGSTMLARSHWGGGTNREMKRLMIAHALQHVATVEFWAWIENARSRRALEKIGARLVDRIENVEMDGRIFPHAVYAINAESFAAGPLSS